MATLVCPQCKNKILKYDIHSESVTCDQCHFDVNITTNLASDLPKGHKIAKSNQGVIINQTSDSLEIQLIWKHFSHWKFNLSFGLGISFVMGILMVIIAGKSLIGLLLCSLFLFAGAYLSNTGWFQWKNVTTILLDNTSFSARHRITNKTIQDISAIPISHISQIYVTRKKVGSTNGKVLYNHEIRLKKRDGNSILILNQIKEAAVAYSIENTLEEFMKIKDVVQLDEFHPQRPNRGLDAAAVIKSTKLLAEIRNESTQSSDVFKAKCPKCHQSISAKDLSEEKELVYCPSCQESFGLLESSILVQDNTHKQFDEVPKGIKVSTNPNGMTISFLKSKNALWKLLIPIAIFLLFFNGLMSSFSVSGYFLFIPVLIIYFLTISLLKRQTIRVSGLYLWVDTFPNWHLGTKTIDFSSSNIQQVFVVQRVIESDESTNVVYDLQFIDRNQQIHYLIKNYRNPQHLWFAETKIESFLNIEDYRVDGEYAPHQKSVPQNMSELIALGRKMYENRGKKR